MTVRINLSSFAALMTATFGVFTAAYAQIPAAGEALDPRVERILSRLEARTINDLHAKVKWTTVSQIESTENIKEGEIWYKEMQPVAKFMVHFNKGWLDQRANKVDERHIFDGRWYVKVDTLRHNVERQELRRVDERANPYKLGEGLFPVPFGQKKAAILKEFDVQTVESNDDPAGTDHLLLVPRPESKTGERFTRLDFWIKDGGENSGLPVKVQTMKKDGTGNSSERTTIEFSAAELNTGFSGKQFEFETPKGWTEKVEPLTESAAAPAGGSTERR